DVEIAMRHQPLSLARRQTDLVLASSIPAQGDQVSRRLGTMSFAIYGSTSYVSRHRHAHDEARHQACGWVGFCTEPEYMPIARWLTERRGIPATFRVTNAIAMLEGARSGVGLALLPGWIADREPGLVRVSDPIGDLTQTTYALFLADRRRDSHLRAM